MHTKYIPPEKQEEKKANESNEKKNRKNCETGNKSTNVSFPPILLKLKNTLPAKMHPM
jgi:hypothetical protein